MLGGGCGGWLRGVATMKSFSLFAAVCAIVLGAEATGHASPITDTIDFTATDFATIIGSGSAPVDPVIGTFTITFDPFVATTGTTITLNNINIQLTDNAPLFFVTRTDFPSEGQLVVCFNPSNATCGASSTDNSFTLDIFNTQSATPTFQAFLITN
jgi:hypothetical protein